MKEKQNILLSLCPVFIAMWLGLYCAAKKYDGSAEMRSEVEWKSKDARFKFPFSPCLNV